MIPHSSTGWLDSPLVILSGLTYTVIFIGRSVGMEGPCWPHSRIWCWLLAGALQLPTWPLIFQLARWLPYMVVSGEHPKGWRSKPHLGSWAPELTQYHLHHVLLVTAIHKTSSGSRRSEIDCLLIIRSCYEIRFLISHKVRKPKFLHGKLSPPLENDLAKLYIQNQNPDSQIDKNFSWTCKCTCKSMPTVSHWVIHECNVLWSQLNSKLTWEGIPVPNSWAPLKAAE